jgi:hypothetical protein
VIRIFGRAPRRAVEDVRAGTAEQWLRPGAMNSGAKAFLEE